jgi:glucose-6-phosphate isomerase
LETDITKNLPLLAALLGVWNRNYLNCETLAVLPYSQALSRFAAHLQQCDMESNGKRINRQGEDISEATGPIVWGEPGTNGQHAFYQLIHQSETVVPCDFIGFRQSQYGEDLKVKGTTSQEKLLANLLAQSVGMATGSASDNPNKVFPGNRPNSLIMADQLTPEVMGQLLAFYENKIAFQGFLWNINSFDQEGVQLGKVLANGILDTYINGKPADENSPTWILMKESGVI